jgi:hypothetical protein
LSHESKLRKWAAEAARQANTETDADQARRLSSLIWTRLAEEEEQRRGENSP